MKQNLKYLLKTWQLYALLIPGVLYLICFKYLPMAGLVIAFKDIDFSMDILHAPWVGLKNFQFLFSTTDAWVITRNTIAYNFTFIILGVIFGVATAIGLNELKNRVLSRVYQGIMFLPYFLSMVVVGYFAYAFLGQQFGFINNSVLKPLGLESVSFYTTPKFWVYFLPFVHIWKGLGYSSVIYLSAIIGIDPELYEAAIMDGASKWKQITNITLPLLKPIVIVLVIMGLGRIFNSDFGLFYSVPMDQGPLYPVTNVVDTYVYRSLRTLGDYGMSSAAAFYQSIVGFITVLLSNYVVRKIDPDSAMF